MGDSSRWDVTHLRSPVDPGRSGSGSGPGALLHLPGVVWNFRTPTSGAPRSNKNDSRSVRSNPSGSLHTRP